MLTPRNSGLIRPLSNPICANSGRIRIFAATIRKFLKKLRRTHEKLYADLLEADFTDHYLARNSDSIFSQVKPSEAPKTLHDLGEDILYLIEHFSSYDTVRALPEYKLLERVLHEQCRVTGSGAGTKVAIKQPGEVPSDSLQNPSDPDAGYDGFKGSGYQAQLMETYQTGTQDDTKPDLITYVYVEPAHEHDSNALQPAIDTVSKRGCRPEELVCDTLYGSDDNVQQAAEKGVEVIAPIQGHTPEHNITLSDFECDETTHFVTRCPEGYEPKQVGRTQKNRLRAIFNKTLCCACPRLKDCPVQSGKKASYLRYDDTMLRMAQRRAHEQTKKFKDRFGMLTKA